MSAQWLQGRINTVIKMMGFPNIQKILEYFAENELSKIFWW